MRSRRLVVLGCLGAVALLVLLCAIRYTARPSFPVVIALMLGVVGLAVVPWTRLTASRLRGEQDADRQLRRVVELSVFVALAGVLLTLFVIGDPNLASVVAMISIFVAGALALLGAVVLPWIFLMVTRERAARVRAEERAEISAHLHDSVLQSLTLIHKRTDDPEIRRLARSTERELRSWLFGGPSTTDDLASVVAAMTAEIEDRYAVTVELVQVGSCAMSAPAHAVVGALREALTNAAKHSGVQRVSALVEVADTHPGDDRANGPLARKAPASPELSWNRGRCKRRIEGAASTGTAPGTSTEHPAEVFALVRDRGCGFDTSVHSGADRRGVVDSIDGRMRQQGGIAVIRSAPGEGTEVELRMPV